MRPALVILAAGASERLGKCKALVDLGGATPLERLVRSGAAMDGAPPLVVAGAHHVQIERRAPAGCEVARNERWAEGRTGGVQLAHRLRPGLDLCLAPVDVPLVPPEVFEALERAWAGAGAPELGWLAPCHPLQGPHSHFGHPVVVGRGLLEVLGDFSASRPLRELRALARPLLSVAVDAPEVLDDLDGPEDLERLRERLGLRS